MDFQWLPCIYYFCRTNFNRRRYFEVLSSIIFHRRLSTVRFTNKLRERIQVIMQM